MRHLRDLLPQFAELSTAVISDALDDCGLPSGQGGIRPMWGRPRVAGLAATVALESTSRRYTGSHILTRAIDAAGPDDVMIVDNSGRCDVSCWGGIVTLGAIGRSIRGAVLDGVCRDVGATRTGHFPVFARGQVPVTARRRLQERSTGTAVRLGDLVVEPGDVVVADEMGVVVIPCAQASEVLERARGLFEREAAIEAEVGAGVLLSQAMRDSRLAGEESS